LIVSGSGVTMRFSLLDRRNPIVQFCDRPFEDRSGEAHFTLPGTYELRVEADIANYEPESPPFLLATRTLIVGAPKPVPVPVGSPWFILTTILFLLFGAKIYVKR